MTENKFMSEEDLIIENALSVLSEFEDNQKIDQIELDKLLEIPDIKRFSAVEYKNIEFKKVQRINRIKKKLLNDYKKCLFSCGDGGYEILSPKEQIDKGYQYYFNKSKRAS